MTLKSADYFFCTQIYTQSDTFLIGFVKNIIKMMMANKTDTMENINPSVYKRSGSRPITEAELDDDVVDPIDQREVFDLIRNVRDPEHPLTLEELHVVEEEKVTVDNDGNEIHIFFTPTIPHCSMATLIGLSIRVKLLRTLPPRFKVTVEVTPGTHVSADSINKQLADKERVAAALENQHLISFINNTFEEEE